MSHHDLHETPAGRARKLLEGAPGPWTLQIEPDYGVDSSGSAPGRRTVVLAGGVEVASDLLASEEQLALMAAAPDLARDVIALQERAERAEADRADDHACLGLLGEIGLALALGRCGHGDDALRALRADPHGRRQLLRRVCEVDLQARSTAAVTAERNEARAEVELLRAALAAVERERDEARAELAAAWEETGRPRAPPPATHHHQEVPA